MQLRNALGAPPADRLDRAQSRIAIEEIGKETLQAADVAQLEGQWRLRRQPLLESRLAGSGHRYRPGEPADRGDRRFLGSARLARGSPKPDRSAHAKSSRRTGWRATDSVDLPMAKRLRSL